MRVLGLRSRYSPIHKATPAQRDAINDVIEQERQRGARLVEVRHTAYIGPGCLAEKGGITVDSDGGIAAVVMPDGTIV